MAVVFHEYAHGWMALRYGDNTAKAAGRLTLNPIPHIDLMGTVVFPILIMITGMNILFGWAKPVPINPRLFKSYRSGLFWVSFAGPGMNFLLGFLSAFILMMIIRFMPSDFYLFEPLAAMARVSVSLNFALGVFNLVPLPPLDGSKLIESFLSYTAMQKYEQLSQYSFFILMALLFTGAIRLLMIPAALLANLSLDIAALLFGIGAIF